MEKSKRVEEINEEIAAIEKLVEGMDKRKNELLKEIKELSEKIEKAE